MTNHEAFIEAKKYIPGGVDSPVRAFGNVGSEPFFVKNAKGAFIYDIEDKKYLDFVLSWGPLIFGHCDKDIEDAVIKAVKDGLSYGASCLKEVELAKLILQDFKFLDKIRFVSSGTEATMSAIRLARGYSKKDGIIKFEGCYHGHSDSLLVQAGSGAATFEKPSSDGVPADIVKNTFVAIYNDIQSVKDIFEKNENKIGAVIIEPIAGNMGLVPAKKEFLQELREICDKFGAVLILDEVMSGYRASKTGSLSYYGVEADIITFGKVIGGGMSVAAFAARDDIMKCISPEGGVYQAGTLSGNPVAMASGIAMINKINSKPNLYDYLSNLSKMLTEGLKDIAKKTGNDLVVDYRGSMFGYFFTNKEVRNYKDACTSNLKKFAKFHSSMINHGVFLAPSQFETGFVCDKMEEKDIEFALNCAYEAMKNL